MDSKDHDEREQPRNNICSLEWIAWAMDAARRYKEEEHRTERPHERSADEDSSEQR